MLHGLCLMDGKHSEGDVYAKECPVRHRERRQKAARAARGLRGGAQMEGGATPLRVDANKGQKGAK